MPTYEYQANDQNKSCPHCCERFEMTQSMQDDALEQCPECGNPVHRLVSRISVSTRQSSKSMLSDKNLKEKGFTKLVNEGEGKFRKTV
jgi:putative FmdB family regulatory protein